jgi:hypothetical protein
MTVLPLIGLLPILPDYAMPKEGRLAADDRAGDEGRRRISTKSKMKSS